MRWLHQLLQRRLPETPTDSVGTSLGTIMRRWILVQSRFGGVYVHNFLMSDPNLSHHDHPCWALSLFLDGAYIEEVTRRDGTKIRKRRTVGKIRLIRPGLAHRIELEEGRPAWTLLIVGPRTRTFGYYTPSGWVPFNHFMSPGNPDGYTITRHRSL